MQNFRVEGASMEPSLHNDEYLLVNKAIYFRVDMDRLHDFLPFVPGGDDSERHLFRAPRRGDVIVFKFPLDPSRDFIKRVIGVPGDTVEVRDETVFINGAPLNEDYILDDAELHVRPEDGAAGHVLRARRQPAQQLRLARVGQQLQHAAALRLRAGGEHHRPGVGLATGRSTRSASSTTRIIKPQAP